MKRLFFTVAALVFLVGCYTPDNQEIVAPPPTVAIPTPTPEPITPVKGGTLRVPMRPPLTLNPLLNEDASVDAVLQLLFEPLMIIDANMKPMPNLATFNFASDGMSVTITLREGLRWTNGLPITSEDIAFSIDTLRQAPENAIYRNNVSNIMPEYTIYNERRIKLQFHRAFSGMAYQFTFPIIPKMYYYGQMDPSSPVNMRPVGNGLFVFHSYTNMKEMRLNFNPDTYRQPPYIANIEVVIVPDQQTELHAFDQRLIDLVSAEIAEWGRHRNNQNTNIYEYPTMYFDFIGFNFNNELLAQLDFRRAIAHSINVDEIVENIYLEHATRAFTPVNPHSWLFEPDVERYNFSLDIATELFESANYDGRNLRILVNMENDERVAIANILHENLSRIGVNTTVESVDIDTYRNLIERDRDFDMFIGGFNLSLAPDLTFAFGSADGASNMFSYSDETMNALLAAAFSAVGDANYQRALSELQRYIAQELPCVSLVFRKSAMLSDTRVLGEKHPVMSNIFANANRWFIPRELQ